MGTKALSLTFSTIGFLLLYFVVTSEDFLIAIGVSYSNILKMKALLSLLSPFLILIGIYLLWKVILPSDAEKAILPMVGLALLLVSFYTFRRPILYETLGFKSEDALKVSKIFKIIGVPILLIGIGFLLKE